MNTAPVPRSSRRALTHGRGLLGVCVVALPIASLVSVAISRMPGLTRDVAVSIGFYLLIPIWVTVACLLFVAARPWRAAAITATVAGLLIVLTRLV